MSTTTTQPELSPTQRLDDLAEIIRAYNEVTQNLQRSHESLQAEVVRLQEQLASTDAQLQRSKRLAALGEMAAGIAHEVRNPLAAIGLYAGMIVEDTAVLAGISPTVRGTSQTATKIVAAVRGLDAIVNDVLSFARDIQPRPVAAPAVTVLRRALEAHRPALETAAITVKVDVDDVVLWVDTDLMHRALLNLIRNAIEAMAEPRSVAERVLTLAAHRDSGRAVLEVRDTGPGIAAEHIDRIFNPFFTTRNSGTGLGLAIVHRIIDAHGGTVAVVNDGGAVFELIVPAFNGRREASFSGSSEMIGASR